MTSIRSLWLRLLTVAVLCTVGLPVLAPATSAEPGVPPAPSSTAAVSEVSPQGVRDHWTPGRMRAAVPLDLDPSGVPLPNGGPAPAPTLPQGASGRMSAATGPGLRTTGKLFFTDGRDDLVCSAAAVNSPGRNLVVTAGHCVNSGGVRGLLGGCSAGSYYRDFLFVPGYDRGAAPYGSWVGTSVVTHSEWVQQCDAFHRDQALLEVAPSGGRNLVDVVGGNALAWNYPVREDGVRIVGWPAQAPYDGQVRHECAGSTTPGADARDAQLSCPMTGGASGGPWFVRLAGADAGFIFAVTSRRTTSGPAVLLARPFDSSIEVLLAATRTAARAGDGSRPREARAGGPRLRLTSSASTVGYGESFQLVARTRRVRTVVLQTRRPGAGRWQRLGKVRVPAGSAVGLDQVAAPGAHRYRIKVRRSTRHSRAVSVTVLPCPFPPDRSPAVVAALRCTSPVG